MDSFSRNLAFGLWQLHLSLNVLFWQYIFDQEMFCSAPIYNADVETFGNDVK